MPHKGVLNSMNQSLRKLYILIIIIAIGMPNVSKAQTKDKGPAFSCDLSVMTVEEREQHFERATRMFSMAKEVKELGDGFAVRFSVDSSMITTVAQFIEKERLCCPFMKFTVEIGEEHGPLWVRITGRK